VEFGWGTGGKHVDLEERFLVHLVRGVEIGEESVSDPVGENGDPSFGYCEISIQLRSVLQAKIATAMLALEKHDDLPVFRDGVIDLFALLDPNVGDEFGVTSIGSKMSYPSMWISGRIRAFLVASSVCNMLQSFSVFRERACRSSTKLIVCVS